MLQNQKTKNQNPKNMTLKFSEISIGEKFATKNGLFVKEGATTAKVLFSPSFPQHEGKICGGFGKNQNVTTQPA